MGALKQELQLCTHPCRKHRLARRCGQAAAVVSARTSAGAAELYETQHRRIPRFFHRGFAVASLPSQQRPYPPHRATDGRIAASTARPTHPAMPGICAATTWKDTRVGVAGITLERTPIRIAVQPPLGSCPQWLVLCGGRRTRRGGGVEISGLATAIHDFRKKRCRAGSLFVKVMAALCVAVVGSRGPQSGRGLLCKCEVS
jgi:hypothetical protein